MDRNIIKLWYLCQRFYARHRLKMHNRVNEIGKKRPESEKINRHTIQIKENAEFLHICTY